MNLRPREKLLALVAAGLILLLAGRAVWGALSRPFWERWAQRASLQAAVEKKRAEIREAERAREQLAQWNRYALPADPEQARLLYQNWLLDLAARVELENKQVESAEVRPHRGIYTRLPFTVRGRGNLEKLTRFLFGFYSAGYLHQIRRLSVQPVEGSSELDLVISVEALSLPGAVAKDRLPQETRKRLAREDVSQYCRAIVDRNIFAPYRPPPPPPVARRPDPPPPPSPPFDILKYTFLNGITEIDGRREAWLFVRPSGENLKLHEGEAFQIGSAKGTVLRINVRTVELEVEGKRVSVAVGQSVRDGQPVAAGSPEQGHRG